MPSDTAAQRQPRGERINLRTTTRQEQVLRQAAAATDKTMTEFILDSAVSQAERVLADRRWFLLDDAKWQEFESLLDAPLRELPKLRGLLDSPSPFADDES